MELRYAGIGCKGRQFGALNLKLLGGPPPGNEPNAHFSSLINAALQVGSGKGMPHNCPDRAVSLAPIPYPKGQLTG